MKSNLFLRAFALISFLIATGLIERSESILKCFSPEIYRSLGKGESGFDYQHGGSVTYPDSLVDNGMNRYDDHLGQQQYQDTSGYENYNPMLNQHRNKKSLFQSKWKGGLLKSKFGLSGWFGINSGLMNSFLKPHPINNNYQGYSASMGPIIPAPYNSRSYQVNGDLNVAPFSIPSQYYGYDSNRRYSSTPSSYIPTNNQQQKVQADSNGKPIMFKQPTTMTPFIQTSTSLSDRFPDGNKSGAQSTNTNPGTNVNNNNNKIVNNNTNSNINNTNSNNNTKQQTTPKPKVGRWDLNG